MNSIDNTPPRYRHAVARRHCHLTLPVRVFWFLTPPLFSFFPFKYPQQGSQLPGTPIRPGILRVGLLRPPSSSPRLKANAHVSSRLLNATGFCHFISWSCSSAWSGTVLWATPASPVPWALAGHLAFATSVIAPSDQAGQWSRRCISGCDEGVRQKREKKRSSTMSQTYAVHSIVREKKYGNNWRKCIRRSCTWKEIITWEGITLWRVILEA
jgi:hypothetical protein